MHHRAVTITLCVLLETLQFGAKSDLNYFVTAEAPSTEAIKVARELRGSLCVDEIHKGIPKYRVRPEVDWEVHEVVSSLETLPVEELEKHLSCISFRDVTEHDRCVLDIAARSVLDLGVRIFMC